MKNVIPALFVVLMTAIPAAAQSPASPGAFDSYVLALSWSPTWCESRAGQQDFEQCGARRYGFVVHGLWPQYRRGGWPERCAASSPLPPAVVPSMLPLMPSRRLIEHEWRTHGTCDGAGAEAYFSKIRQIHQRLVVPEPFRAPDRPQTLSAAEVESAFVAANPGLSRNALTVTCRGGRIAEVRICLSRDLSFAACGDGGRDRCRGALRLPAAR